MSSIPSAGDDTLDGDVDSPDFIQGLAGNDLIRGNGADTGETDQLEGQAGNDTLVTSGSGFGVLDGGTGDDSIVAGAPQVDTGAGGAGNDTLVGDAGTDYLFGDDVDFFGAPPSAASGNDVLDGGDGADLLSGGPGDDILTPGASGNVFTLVDSLRGGDGDDTLALPGDPAGYNISLDGFGNVFVQSNALLGGANVRAILDSIETLAFGVTAQQLAAGAAPLTTASLGDLFSPPPTTGRAHFAISDTVSAPTGTQLVAISIAQLLANDVDPDGDTLTLQSLTPTGGPGIAAFRIIARADVASEGYDPADFPEGVLELSLTAPLTAPLRFTYQTTVEAEDGSGNSDTVTGSTATVTVNPVAAADDQLRATYGAETFIPYATLLANDGPGAIWGGLSNAFATDGSTILDDPARGGVVIDSPGPFLGGNAFFDYSLAGVPGTATVSIEIDNGAPVAVPLARVVTPGTTFTTTFDEIAGHDGHLDPNLDNLVFGAVTGSSGSGATFTVTATGIDVTFDATYSGGFSIGYTLADTPLGAVSAPSTISFLTAAPPAPVANSDTLAWGIGDGVSLFAGSRPGYGVVWSRELLANDSFMPGTVRIWNAPSDLTPGDNSQLTRALERGIPGVFGVTDPTDNGFGLEFRPGITSDTLVYTIIDPLGREAQGQITFNISVPQPRLADNVIVIPAGATSVTLSAADILGNDTFTGAGAIAEVLGIGVGGIVDSGVDIGGGRTGIDRFTVDFNPPGLSPGQPLSVFTLNILTFDTAAAGGSANGRQSVTFVRDTAPPPVLPTVSLDAATAGTVNEGNNATATFNAPLEFTIRRSGDLSQAGTVTFVLDAPSGSALTAADIGFVAAGGNGLGSGFGPFAADFAAGEESKIIFVFAAGDRVPEADEAVRLTLTGGTGATLSTTGPLSATGTFANDDVFPEIALSSASAGASPEGDEIGGQLRFIITRAGDLSYATEVTFSLGAGAGGTTAGDIAFIADGGNAIGSGFGTFAITFNPGETQRIITVAATGDTVPEADEGVVLTLLAANEGTLSTTGPLSATGTFANDDIFPEIALASASAGTSLEGDAVSGQLQFVIIRAGDLSYATEVSFSLGAGAGGTTAGDIAFIADGGNAIGSGFGTFAITFNPGETQRIITVAANGDTVPEADEGVVLTLTGAALGTLSTTGPLSATGTFANDDIFPEIALSSASAGTSLEGDAVSGQLQFVVTRSGDLSYATEVTFSLGAGAGGTTAGDIAFIADGGNAIGSGFGTFAITFNPGETQRIITVAATGDTVPEADEGVVLTLLAANEGTLSTTGPLSATGTFANDDVTPPNAPPLGVADRVGTTRNTAVTFDILANDSDVDGDPLFAGGFTLPANGTLAINGGLVTYTPRAGFFGTDSFTYRPFDGTVQGDITTVTIDVSGPNGDFLIGTPGPDTLDGLGGNDTILGLASADRLIGNVGDDSISADAGNDTLFGNGGRDTLAGGADDDSITGGIGDDSLLGDAGRDALSGDAGADTLRGGDDADTLNGFGGEDLLDGGEGDDIAAGGAGADTLLGLGGDDVLRGANGIDSLVGGAGRDTLNGGADNDTLLGGTEADSLAGSLGNDSLAGEEGDDTLGGGEGNDTARGGEGRDLIRGAAGDDLLFGDAGDDRLVGGAGADTIEGGADDGAFVFTDGDLTGYRAGDVIDLRGPGGGGDGVADLIIHREGPAGPGSGGLDVILGFEPGLDRILFIDTIGEANGTTRVFNSGDLAGGFFASSGYSLTAGIFIVGVSGVTVTEVNGDWVLS